ncbi:hypothetical protein GSI_09857 [Ganoderma sinense ZZ0214-1]|uniref:Uncharacterized protein n=1 Tax=Ganoderma sinense ZZ0214-1 TaxID=1077348 RepID=A0A2G8S2L1_9APHY|nr:hypothetical protein GSI_09857 [Ganoderma sinense ZZ0214-1]
MWQGRVHRDIDVQNAAFAAIRRESQPRAVGRERKASHNASESENRPLSEGPSVPEPHGPILGSSRNRAAVRGPCARHDGRGICISFELGDFAARAPADVPNRHRPGFIVTGRNEIPTIRGEHEHRHDSIATVRDPALDCRSAGGVPEDDGRVPRSAGHPLAVRRDHEGLHPAVVLRRSGYKMATITFNFALHCAAARE